MKTEHFKQTGCFRLLICALLLGLLLPGFLCAATSPTEAIRSRVDAVIAILKDPVYQEGGAKMDQEQHDALFNAVKDLLDFRTISMLATGQNWKRFSSEEKTQFTDAFARLLANTYIEKLQDNFKNETVVYDGEDKISKDRSEVRTHIQLSDGKTVPVLYKLRLIQGDWRVYDAYIENISLVQNYRTQFDDYLMKKEPAELIHQMESRVQQLEKERAERKKAGKNAPSKPADDPMKLNL